MANSILGGRYLSQAQAAHASGMDVLVLIVEGELRPSPEDGLVEVPFWGMDTLTVKRTRSWKPVEPAIGYSRWEQYLTELDRLAGIIVKRSLDVRETANMIKALWSHFQRPPSKHTSLHRIYSSPSDKTLLMKPGLVRRVAKEFEGIGWERSLAVSQRFSTLREMIDADVDQWLTVDGIGRKTAEKVVASIGTSEATGIKGKPALQRPLDKV